MVDKKQESKPFSLPEEAIVPGAAIPQNQINLQQAMQQAQQLQSQGQLQQAESVLRQILGQKADCAPALHLLGVIAHQSGQLQMAIEFVRQSVAINDQVPLFNANLGEMLRLDGDIDGAIRHGERAVELDPSLAGALSNLGVAYFDKEEFEKSRKCHEKALALEANLPQSLNNMGSIMRELDQPEKAMEFYHRATAADVTYLEPLNNLGLVLIEEDRHAEAIAPLTNAVNQNPNYSDAWCNLACAYTVLEQFDKSIPAYQKAIEIRPDYLEAYLGLTQIYLELDNYAEALKHIEQALEIDPEKAEAHALLASLHNEMAYLDRAEAAYQKALELDQTLVQAWLGRGHMHMEEGNFDVAEECFSKALEYDEEDSLVIRFAFTQLRKVREDNPHFRALLEVEDASALRGNELINYYYALGKCHDDIGEHERAFECYIKGAKLKRDSIGYDPRANASHTERIMQVFSLGFIQQHSGAGNDSSVPIFILGMPRSGTTLTEQIIASHPQVYGAGELPEMKDLSQRLVSPGGREYPQNVAGLNGPGLKMLGDEYLRRLTERAPESAHITDKMPANFLFLGLIYLMLPRAKIIHVQRHPLDTCISGFTRLFRHNQNQSYDLFEQGQFYRDYFRLMQHWREVLPEGSFYEVQYEKLVEDNEAQTRALIDYCGLPWDEACLSSHKTRRKIKTASITQVRQPIYTSSLERWRRYERFLEPLRQGLADVLP